MRTPAYVFLYLVTFVCALFDATLSHRLTVLGVRPELVYVIPLFWALQNTSDEAIVHAWAAGLMKDLFSVSTFGTYGFLFAFTALLVILVQSYLYRDSLLTLGLTAFGFQVVVNGLYGGYLYAIGANLSLWQMGTFTLLTALYSKKRLGLAGRDSRCESVIMDHHRWKAGAAPPSIRLETSPPVPRRSGRSRLGPG